MARPLRIEIAGGLYHVMSRGNAKAPVFLDDDDRIVFIDHLATTVATYRWRCYAWCLMNNHYHLLVETPEPNLSAGMHLLNGTYTQTFNRRWHRPGHLFQGRFKSIIVEKETYLLELVRYIVLNPVRARMVSTPDAYRWSSYRATAGLIEAPGFLFTQWRQEFFPSETTAETITAYADFINSPSETPEAIRTQRGVVLGSSGFVEKLRPRFREVQSTREFTRSERFASRPMLAEIFEQECLGKAERDELIYRAIMEYGYTLADIAVFTGLHYSTISRIRIECAKMRKYKT